METAFFFVVYLIPCLLYVSEGLFIIMNRKRHKEGVIDETGSKTLRDLVFVFFLFALCFVSGCSHMLCEQNVVFSAVADQIVIKLYLATSVIPCILIRRYAGSDMLGKCSWIPIVLALSLMVIADVAFHLNYGGLYSGILFRCSVVAVFLTFCFVLYVSVVSGSQVLPDGSSLGRELQMHLLILAFNNFMVLGYSFGLHALFDYVVLVIGFAVMHSIMFILLVSGKTLSSLVTPQEDGMDEEYSDEEEFPLSADSRQDLLEEPSMSLKERLISYFEYEKPYLSKDINMQEVAMRLFTNKSYLSKTINTEMNKNFRELVNYFRVREAIKIFSTNMEMSMAELRDRCGFNNNASFTSAFKLNTGYTPGEWCRDMKNRMTYEDERRKSNEKL